MRSNISRRTPMREAAAGIEDPFKCGQFNRFPVFPWPLPIDELGFVEPVNGFRQPTITRANTSMMKAT